MASPLEMVVKNWTVGDLAAVIYKIGEDNARRLQQCDQVTVEFEEASNVAKVVGKRLAKSKPARPRLRSVGKENLPEQAAVRDLVPFFKTRDGLYVWSEFINWILAVVAVVETVAAATVEYFDLEQNSTDAQIRKELPSEHIFEDASAFCVHLVGMIERQWGGTEGPLLTNGYANIFYVKGVSGEVFAVRVSWYADVRSWNVSVYRLDGLQWYAGNRVFSRTAAA